MNKRICYAIALLLGATVVQADPAPKQAATCVACHGVDGNSSNPEWPSLAGQKSGYLLDQINAFRSGRRENPLMTPMIAVLRDADVQVLADYYAGQMPRAARGGDAGLVAAGQQLAAYCKACHGMRGKTANPEWPNLAGQQAKYLQQQLAAYKAGQRQHPHMQTVVARFGDEEFAALAAYYSHLEPRL